MVFGALDAARKSRKPKQELQLKIRTDEKLLEQQNEIFRLNALNDDMLIVLKVVQACYTVTLDELTAIEASGYLHKMIDAVVRKAEVSPLDDNYAEKWNIAEQYLALIRGENG